MDVGALTIAVASTVRPQLRSVSFEAFALTILWSSGSYRPRISYRFSTQIPALLGLLTIAALVVSSWPGLHRLAILEHLPAIAGIVVAARVITYGWLRRVRSHSPRPHDAIIIGADLAGCRVADALLGDHRFGIRPVGFVDRGGVRPDHPLPVVADLAHLDHAIQRLAVKHVIVAGRGQREAIVGTSLWHGQSRDIDVWVIPPLFDFASPDERPWRDVWAIPFQPLRRPGRHLVARMVKRTFDFSVSAAMALLFAPLTLVVALTVRLTSRGPVFFHQIRIGQHGREFELLKFRTMTVNDDSDTMWSVTNDHRMTPVGKFLRRSCLDELPQLLNVIRGDMSLVGPRPERPYFASHFTTTVPHYSERLRVPVGITGWAQIHGLRGDTSIVDRTRFDNFYIEHWSLLFDVVIMLRTLTALLQWAVLSDPSTVSSSPPRPESASRPPGSMPAEVPARQS